LSFNNPYKEQPIQFIAQVISTNAAEWTNPVIEINNYAKLEVPFSVSRGQILVCNGKQLQLMDENRNTLKTVEVKNLPSLSNGSNKILIDGAITGESTPEVKIEWRVIGEGEEIRGKK